MFDYTDISIKEFQRCVDLLYTDNNKDKAHPSEIIKDMSRISFSQFARSDSLYFSLPHALSSAKIGLEILNAIKCRLGVVRQGLAINFMASILFCNVGIIKGVLSEDTPDKFKINDDDLIKLSIDGTDSILWKYKSYRSCRFIEKIPFLNTNTNMELVAQSIEYSDIWNDEKHQALPMGTIDKYNKATQIITLMSDSNYNRKLAEYYYSAKEADIIDEEIFPNLGQFKEKWAQYFWDTLYSDVAETILMLRETDKGRNIVSSIYTHL